MPVNHLFPCLAATSVPTSMPAGATWVTFGVSGLVGVGLTNAAVTGVCSGFLGFLGFTAGSFLPTVAHTHESVLTMCRTFLWRRRPCQIGYCIEFRWTLAAWNPALRRNSVMRTFYSWFRRLLFSGAAISVVLSTRRRCRISSAVMSFVTIVMVVC